MTRDDLESVIWKALRMSRRSLTGVTDHRADVRAVDSILSAADEYGRAEYGITAERRAVLDARDNSGIVHLLNGELLACRPLGCFVMARTMKTTVPERVTCRSCRSSDAWLQSNGAQVTS